MEITKREHQTLVDAYEAYDDLRKLPAYDPSNEITAPDLAKRNGKNYKTCVKHLQEEVEQGTSTCRQVRLKNGREATAYRKVV